MIKKCPWCGNNIPVNMGTFGEYSCKHCKKKSYVKRDGWSYWLPALVSLIFFLALRSIFALPSLILIYLAGLFNSYYAPLKRSFQKYVPVKSAAATFELKEKTSFFSKKLKFVEDSVFIICFKDENEKPISHMLAVSIDDIKISKQKITCVFSFMPECEYNTDYSAYDLFNLYDNNSLIAEGRITSDVEYKKLPVADNKL